MKPPTASWSIDVPDTYADAFASPAGRRAAELLGLLVMARYMVGNLRAMSRPVEAGYGDQDDAIRSLRSAREELRDLAADALVVLVGSEGAARCLEAAEPGHAARVERDVRRILGLDG